ncbi:hypothetical protein [Paenibacillus sp. TSA_86.1]|uniref:hypothetical protein n=1 Tax=Paenibacillus sp. TSA_86.1 TaxID=3415649 RepID=UPI004046326C
MTYSQRLSGGASLSDIMYLEQQIAQVKKERDAATEELKRYEHEWIPITSDLKTHVDSLTTRLEELETALDEMVD